MIKTIILCAVVGSLLAQRPIVGGSQGVRGPIRPGGNTPTDVLIVNPRAKGSLVSFNLDGGKSSKRITSFYAKSLSASDFAFDLTKPGQVFHGWSLDGVQIFNSRGDQVNSFSMKPKMVFKAIFDDQVRIFDNTKISDEIKTAITCNYFIHEAYESPIYMYLNDDFGSYDAEYAKVGDKLTIMCFRGYNDAIEVLYNGFDLNDKHYNVDELEYNVEKYEDIYFEAYYKLTPFYLTLLSNDENAGYLDFVVCDHEYEGKSPMINEEVAYYNQGGIGGYYYAMANCKAGYYFRGWYADVDFTEKYEKTNRMWDWWGEDPNYPSEGGEWLVGEDFGCFEPEETYTICGLFGEVGQHIEYDLDGGSFVDESEYPTSFDDFTGIFELGSYSLNSPVKPGYNFVGWVDEDGNRVAYLDHKDSHSAYLKAVYAPISQVFSITYDLKGGHFPAGVTNPTTYTPSAEDIKISAPIKPRCVFMGWKINGSSTTYRSIPAGMSGDLVLSAVWRVIVIRR